MPAPVSISFVSVFNKRTMGAPSMTSWSNKNVMLSISRTCMVLSTTAGFFRTEPSPTETGCTDLWINHPEGHSEKLILKAEALSGFSY